MWKDISKAWQSAFAAGWESFRNGSVPIGAVITGEDGNILCTGRNRIYEITEGNSRIAHAEMDCLLQLDTNRYPNLKKYALYTCMEPCPMCMGTIVMSSFRNLFVAARDSYCGAVHYCEEDPYIRSKKIQVVFELGDLQLVQLTMQAYFELKRRKHSNRVLECFENDCPQAVALARRFYREKLLDAYVGKEAGEIFDWIVTEQKT